MIQPLQFLHHLTNAGIEFYTGVPDSLLKGLITAIAQEKADQHMVAVNEGAAVGLATGYHLATGKIPVVYLQNSGLGNIINPITSMVDREVYGIPMLLVIGWRGEPGIKDEPQHSVMGKITPTLLHQVHVPFLVLKKDDDHEWIASLDEALALCQKENRPVAILVEKGVFPEEELTVENDHELSVKEAIEIIYPQLKEDDIVICTTGRIGRTFYGVNAVHKKISRYFLNVGAMGHAISIATGLARYVRNRVVLLDGDGSLLMHMGALALTSSLSLSNLKYILLNNGAHQSVGSQPTLGFSVDFCTIAKGCGFNTPVMICQRAQLNNVASQLDKFDFMEIRINLQTDSTLPRPLETPGEAKQAFRNAIDK